MAVHAIGSGAPAARVRPAVRLVFWLRVRLAGLRLDARLPAGEDPSTDAGLAQLLMTEPASTLYRSARPEGLYESARQALLALGPDMTAGDE